MFLRHFVRAALAAVLVSATVCAFAASAAPGNRPAGSVVTAVESPAWVVNLGGDTLPLQPGMMVGDGDVLRTAAGGRVYIDLPEHSRVKLGEKTEFVTPTMDMRMDQQGSPLFMGVLHLLKGVFRFTTSLVGKSEHRDVSIQVGTATIGIRGTDVWGRTGANGSLVALLEGHISMEMPGHPEMTMDQPMHYMMMTAVGTMQENVRVTQANMTNWAAQTDVTPGDGILTRDGKWTVALISSTDDADTVRLKEKLATAGYPSEDLQVKVKGRVWHRLVIQQVASYTDAKAIEARVSKQFPLMSPWLYLSKN